MAPATTPVADDSIFLASESGNQIFANKCISVRLDDDNFLLWKQQVLLLIRGHGLESFLDSSTPVPPSTVTSESGERVVNPLYTRFRKQDSSLASWLLSTISPSILPQLVGAETSSAIWNAVVRLYSTLSTTKVMRLHCRLRSLKKGSLPMRSYISQIREICDLLATCGSKVSEVEQIATILNGLPVEYEAIIAVLTASREPYSLEAATDVLVDAEARMMDPMRTLVGINYTQQVSTKPLSDSTDLNSSVPSEYRTQQRVNNSSGGGGARFRSRARPQCQLCGKLGHMVDRCWHRFDQNFKGVAASKTSNSQANMCYFTSDEPCYNPCVSNSAGTMDMTSGSPLVDAHVNTLTGSSNSGVDKKWYLDSGATHHVTGEQKNVQSAQPFSG